MAKQDGVTAYRSEITEWVEAFLVDRQAANLSPNTIRFYGCNLGKFAQYCQDEGIENLEAVTADHFRRFLLWLESEGHNPGGIHAHYRICKTFIRWWIAEMDPGAPCEIFQKIKAPKLVTPPLPPVSLGTVKALLKTCGRDWLGVRDRAVILALLDTGARAAEILAFDVEDLNLITGAAFIRKGKGGKPRSVYLGKDARRALRRYLRTRKTGALWTKQNGERLSYSGLRKILLKRSKLAGVDLPTLHAFRRAFAVNMLRAGVDFETLRRLMGHADYTVLKRYLNLLDEDLRRAHAHASPADRLNERR